MPPDVTLGYTFGTVDGALTEVLVNGSAAFTASYDANGLLMSRSQAAAAQMGGWQTLTDAEVDGQDRLRSFWINGAGDEHLFVQGFTADGRVSWRRSESQVTCYHTDVLNALRRVELRTLTTSLPLDADPCADTVSDIDTLVAYDIDPRGRRVGRREYDCTGTGAGTVACGAPGTEVDHRRWIYRDALNPVAQLDASGRITQRYVYGTTPHTPVMIETITYDDLTAGEPVIDRYVVISDIRGSVRRVVNTDTRAVWHQLDYDPWGRVVFDSNPRAQPFGFAGGEYDPLTQLVRFGARDYDALTGRWMAKDPIGFGGGDSNLYAYVGGDPVNAVDVTGLVDCSLGDAICMAACEVANNDHNYCAPGSGGLLACVAGEMCPCVCDFANPVGPGFPPIPMEECPEIAGIYEEHEAGQLTEPETYCAPSAASPPGFQDGNQDDPGLQRNECAAARRDLARLEGYLQSGQGSVMCQDVARSLLARVRADVQAGCQ